MTGSHRSTIQVRAEDGGFKGHKLLPRGLFKVLMAVHTLWSSTICCVHLPSTQEGLLPPSALTYAKKIIFVCVTEQGMPAKFLEKSEI